jgi:flagellar basal-body rod protein FlgF
MGRRTAVLALLDLMDGEMAMLTGLYNAAGALGAATASHEMAAENLAHATTPGYRRRSVMFEAVDHAAQQSGYFGVSAPSEVTHFEPGPLQHTDNPLDLALSADAFFALDGPSGPVYTRAGCFELNARGELQSTSGLRVRGTGGGAIVIPPNTNTITVNSQGFVYADNAQVGQLQLATFSDARGLRRVGPSLFEGPAPQTPTLGSVRVEQGYREGSNVQIVQEMVALIVGMRHYQAAQKAMTALSESVQQHAQLQS